jgi:hypothetical protein
MISVLEWEPWSRVTDWGHIAFRLVEKVIVVEGRYYTSRLRASIMLSLDAR